MEIQHCSHIHPLIQCQGDSDHFCGVCGLKPIRAPVHGCTACNFFVHSSCAELPPEIHHPFHPEHPLLLHHTWSGVWCAACGKTCTVRTFHCQDCKFDLCVHCVPLRPTFKCKHHHHLLTLIREYQSYASCQICNSSLSHGECILRCVPCCFSCHVQCAAMLPETVKLGCHRHALQFTDSLADDRPAEFTPDPDLHLLDVFYHDFEEYYCDACEELRTPKQAVYHCAKCNFVAHLYCAVHEILPTLMNQASERDDFVDDEVTTDPVLGELDNEIKILQAESDELTKTLEELNMNLKAVNIKLKDLEKKREQHVQTASSTKSKSSK